MNKLIKIISVIAIVIICVTVVIFKDGKKQIISPNSGNISFTVEGENIILKDGICTKFLAPGLTSSSIIKYFGNEAKGDLNKDGIEDIAFLVTRETGGTGTFYYVVGAIKDGENYNGTDALFIGDRIAPQNISIENGKLLVNYADRKPGESFAVRPSVGVSLWLLLDTKTMQFGEVVPNFEGEADPSVMKLNMKTWIWLYTVSKDKETRPKKTDAFSVTFRDSNIFSATTDCNGVGGEYIQNDQYLSFKNMMSTLMFCENSQESEFVQMLNQVESYKFNSKGQLLLNLKGNSGTMIFK